MRRPGLPVVRLAPPVRRVLRRLIRRGKAEHRLVQRAQIVLMAARGRSNAEIAQAVGCDAKTVWKWRTRMAACPRVATLEDRPRTGRPAKIPVAARCFVGMLGCTDPMSFGLERTTWSQQALADVLLKETGSRMSRSEVCRTLASLEIAPHRYRQWIHSPDPEFAAKAKVICDYYLHPPDDTTVLCVDEKPGIQALERRFSTHRSMHGPNREEFEYIRHGTQVLIAALEVRTGKVFGQVRDKRKAVDLVEFMEALAKRYPTGKVVIIWDNLNIHYDGRDDRWTRFNERHDGRFQFIYTPKHASWLNQVEIWFSILSRRILRRGSFASQAELRTRISSFIDSYEAKPFNWTFRGKFGEHRPRITTCKTTKRCQRPSPPSRGTPKLSRDSFMPAISRILLSASVAPS